MKPRDPHVIAINAHVARQAFATGDGSVSFGRKSRLARQRSRKSAASLHASHHGLVADSGGMGPATRSGGGRDGTDGAAPALDRAPRGADSAMSLEYTRDVDSDVKHSSSPAEPQSAGVHAADVAPLHDLHSTVRDGWASAAATAVAAVPALSFWAERRRRVKEKHAVVDGQLVTVTVPRKRPARLYDADLEEAYRLTVGDARARTALRCWALLLLLVAWFLFAWFIFVYGMLIYQNLGERAEAQFTIEWLTGVGLENATQWKSVVQNAVTGVVLVLLLDRLNLTEPGEWFEAHVDTLSVQAVLAGRGALTWWQRTKHWMKHNARVEEKG